MAHDVNNYLTAVVGFADLLIPRLDDSESKELAAEIRKSALRCAALANQVMAMSRAQHVRYSNINLNSVILDLQTTLRQLVGGKIELAVDVEPDLPWVKANPGQIQQIVMNLVLNARDAIGDRGRITIVTGNVGEDRVLLAVSDTGTGIDPAILSRIFEPFFTTKPAGRGTGLGLATVMTIVEAMGGRLTVKSEQGQGTRFLIYLPAAVSEAETPTTGILNAPFLRRGSHSIRAS